MKIIFVILFCFLLSSICNSQNYFTSKIAAGVHFGGKSKGGKNFDPGLFISGYAEPRLSKSGNAVFNIDFGLFKLQDSSANNSGSYNVLVGYKQKIIGEKSNYYITGLVGATFRGFGFKIGIGNEYKILRKSFLSLDIFYCRSLYKLSSVDSESGKVASVFGVTLGAGVFNK